MHLLSFLRVIAILLVVIIGDAAPDLTPRQGSSFGASQDVINLGGPAVHPKVDIHAVLEQAWDGEEERRLRDLLEFQPHPKPPTHKHENNALYLRKYSDQLFVGAHNSVAVRTPSNGWILSGNQYYGPAITVEAGVHLLQSQGHLLQNPITGQTSVRLCHTSCALYDGGSLIEHLMLVRAFLDRQPFEVVTLLFVNSGVPLTDWLRAFIVTGLAEVAYIPPRQNWHGRMGLDDWPTLQEMVENGKRLVVFLSAGANQELVPWLLPQWDYVFETDYNNDIPEEFDCLPNRPVKVPPGSNFVPDKLGLVNHFLYTNLYGVRYPNASYVHVTNAPGSSVGMLGEHLARCKHNWGRRPNFVLVDFWSEGDEDGVWGAEEFINSD